MRSLSLFLALAMAAASPVLAAESRTDQLDFTVLRDGDAIGTHAIHIQRHDDATTVSVDTNVVVKVALIPVYRFEHHGHESWRGDHLTTLQSTTNDDGTPHKLAATAEAGDLAATGDNVMRHLSTEIVPASLWNPATLRQTQVMNTLDGHPMAVQIADLGPDLVKVHGQATPARHYAITGELNRELWYDATGRLVRVRFKAKDDSDIQYVLN